MNTQTDGSWKFKNMCQRDMPGDFFEEWALHIRSEPIDATTFVNMFIEMLHNEEAPPKRAALSTFVALMKPRSWSEMCEVMDGAINAETRAIFKTSQGEEFYAQFKAMVITCITEFYENFILEKSMEASTYDLEKAPKHIKLLEPLDPSAFEEFSGHARDAMAKAWEEAKRLNCDVIGAEHVLLAILKKDGCIAVKALLKLGIDLKKVIADIEELVSVVAPPTKAPGEFSFSSRARHVISLAPEVANELSHYIVATEHLLLAILKEGCCVAAQVLTNHRLTYASTKDAVIKIVGLT